MTEQPKNVDFHDTSFLQGHNATYVEQLHGQWARDPAAVDAAWDRYFAALGDSAADAVAEAAGPSWKRADWPPMPAGENISALTGEWPMTSKSEANAAMEKIAAKAAEKGKELDPAQMRQAVLDRSAR